MSLSSVAVLERILSGVPHYFGGPWALSFHELIETDDREPPFDVFVRTRQGWRAPGAATVRFHLDRRDAYELGIEAASIDGEAVRVTNRARTLLDLLDCPRAFPKLDPYKIINDSLRNAGEAENLIDYALSIAAPATCQRLGILLSRRELPWPSLLHLRDRVQREARSLISLHRDRMRQGRLNRHWLLIENDEAPLRADGAGRSAEENAAAEDPQQHLEPVSPETAGSSPSEPSLELGWPRPYSAEEPVIAPAQP